MQDQAKRLTVCSFFSGGGLLDIGFKPYFDIIWANEMNGEAAKSYRSNIGQHIVVGDITSIPLEKIPSADVFIGGPPCIDFSTEGANRGEQGIHGKLIWSYQQIVKAKMPKAFLMENVTGLAKRHKETLQRFEEAFDHIGYKVSTEILDAAQFGTAQNRKRVFVVGIRKDLNIEFEFPKALNSCSVTVKEAIGDLLVPDKTELRNVQLGTIPNHVATWTNPTPARIQSLIENPRPNQRVGIRRLEWNKVSHTLTAHIAKDGREYLHPSEDRRITVREALRIMGVPDSYVIPNSVQLSQQYRLVGNGVAYPVAKALAEALRKQL